MVSMDSDLSVQEHHDRIQPVLGEGLDGQWDLVLDQWTDADASEREAVRANVSGLRDRLLRAVLESESVDDLDRVIATQYIEVKCRWTMLNMQIQRQTARDGGPEQPLLYRVTCLSLIVQSLESVLCFKRIDRLATFFAEPLTA